MYVLILVLLVSSEPQPLKIQQEFKSAEACRVAGRKIPEDVRLRNPHLKVSVLANKCYPKQ